MSRGFDHDDRDFDERSSQSDPQARMVLSQGRGGGSETTKAVPSEFDLNEIRSRIDRAADGAPTVTEFLDHLAMEDVRAVPSLQADGRWNGMSYEFSGVRVTGSQLGRAYTASGLQNKKGVNYDPSRDDGRLRSLAPARVAATRPNRERSVQREALTAQQEQVLWEAGRFRSVALADLAREHYGGDLGRLERDLDYLSKLGLAARHTIPVNGQGRTLTVVTLTRSGQDHLRRENPPGRQMLHRGLVKPRELSHDASIYRMYLVEAKRIEAAGGRVQRVILDYELKKEVYSPLAKAHDLSPLARAERQQEIAEENNLPIVDGRIALPDLRIEYETAEGDIRYIDLELATQNYRAAHIQTKAAAGFKVYAQTNSGPLSRVLDNHHLIAEILRG